MTNILAADAISNGFVPYPITADKKGCRYFLSDPIDIISKKSLQHNGNIGIRCGHESNIVIIDVDKQNNGIENWISLVKYGFFDNDIERKNIEKEIRAFIDIPTVTARTGGGGFHYYFRYDNSLDNITSKCNFIPNYPGIDFLSNKKGCVYVGSSYNGCGDNKHQYKCGGTNDNCLFKGNKYEWIRSPNRKDKNYSKILGLPSWIYKLLIMKKNNHDMEENETTNLETKSTTNLKTKSKTIINKNITKQKIDDQLILKILDLLDQDRWENRDKWIRCVWALKNIGIDKEIIKKYSKKTKKNNYDEESFNQIYYSCKSNVFSIGSIYHWLKEDIGKSEYIKFRKENNIDQFVEEPLICPKTIYCNDEWVKNYADMITDTEKVTVINAFMGMGKTFKMIEYLNTLSNESIIILSSRKTFTNSISGELLSLCNKPFDNYLDLNGNETQTNYYNTKYLIVQIESLHKLKNRFNDNKYFDIVIVDEAESVEKQYSSNNTNKDNLPMNWQVFEDLHQFSKKIFYMDAFISNRTFRLLNGLNLSYNFYLYTKAPEVRYAYECDTKDLLLKKLIESLKKGEKNYMYVSSKDKLNTFVNTIRSIIPACKILEYSSDRKSTSLNNIVEEWKGVDLVISTASITVGCNFNLDNIFHNIFIYYSASSMNCIREMFQATKRIRFIINKTLYFYLDSNYRNLFYCSNRQDILYDTTYRENLLRNSVGSDYFDELDYIFKDLHADNKLEEGQSVMKAREVFKIYLKKCGYILKDPLDDIYEPIEYVKEEFEYDELDDLELNDVEELNKKKIETNGLTAKEICSINKYYFEKKFQLDKTNSEELNYFWKLYCKIDGKSKFKFLVNEKRSLEDIKRSLNGNLNITSDMFVTKIEIKREIETLLKIVDGKILRSTLQNIIPTVKKMYEKIIKTFNIRNYGNKLEDIKDLVFLLNQIYAKVSYDKITADKLIQTRVNGKRICINDFLLINSLDYNLKNSIIYRT